MNTIRFTNKDEFVAALEARRKFWRDHDAKQAKDHKAAEQKWLIDTRAQLREAVKWDYATLSKSVGYNGRLYRVLDGPPPTCPKLQEPRLDRVIASLNLTHAKVFNVDSQGAWSEAHSLLTWDPSAKETVC